MLRKSFVFINVYEEGFELCILDNQVSSGKRFRFDSDDKVGSVIAGVERFSLDNNVKVVAAGVFGGDFESVASALWLECDIVPFRFENGDVSDAFDYLRMKFDENFEEITSVDTHGEAEVHDYLVGLDDYMGYIGKNEFSKIVKLSRNYKYKRLKMAFFNSTPKGGGVSIMRHAMLRFYKLLGLDVKWYVIGGDDDFFKITKKKFHNVLQGMNEEGIDLSKADIEHYEFWSRENFEKFREVFEDVDVVVIDDPQPCGMIPYIKKLNKNICILYRSHIYVDSSMISVKGSLQEKVWNFLYDKIRLADIFISHPVREFVPNNVDLMKVRYIPPSTDPFDGLNKKLTDKQMDYYLDVFDGFLEGLNQTKLDRGRESIIQIARFDPSKGIFDVLESYRLLRERLAVEGKVAPQLIVAGNGAKDDPEGEEIFLSVIERISKDDYDDIRDDIKVARLEQCDQLMNAVLEKSLICLQLSHKEGFEFKVTEALMKAKPTIIYREGGLVLQVFEEDNGYVCEVGDLDAVANRMYDLYVDKELYKKMSKRALRSVNHNFLTHARVADYLALALEFANKVEIDKNEISEKEKVEARV